MNALSTIAPGDQLPTLELPPVSRLTLALYCGASGDHNPIHVDTDYAKAAGHDDVFAHGMLSMAYLGRLLTAWRPQSRLRSFSVRFAAITKVHDQVACTGRVRELIQRNGETLACLDLQVQNQRGETTLVGHAEVCVD